MKFDPKIADENVESQFWIGINQRGIAVETVILGKILVTQSDGQSEWIEMADGQQGRQINLGINDEIVLLICPWWKDVVRVGGAKACLSLETELADSNVVILIGKGAPEFLRGMFSRERFSWLG